MQKNKNYITPIGYKKLLDEQEMLLREERPELCKMIAWAAGNGDRSENADYIYGKRRLREIDKRLRFLKGRIENAVVVDPQDTKGKGKVLFGSTVRILDEEGEVKLYHIVGVDETDPSQGKVSWQSPIGRSLLGKSVGDDVLIKTPQGEFEVSIEEIL